MLSPSLALAAPVFVTARSAGGPTMVPLAVAELLLEFESLVLLLTDAVLLKAAPGVRLAGAKTTSENVSELPAAMAAPAVWVTLLPDCPNVNESVPAVCVIDTKVEPEGNVSVS